MNGEFVPYQVSLDMKELGFDDMCFFWFDGKNQSHTLGYNRNESWLNGKNCSSPTFSQCFRWFREKYDLQHEIYYLDDLIKNGYKITDTSTNTELTEFQYKHNYFELGGYDFEEAELACLIKLIEITKTK